MPRLLNSHSSLQTLHLNLPFIAWRVNFASLIFGVLSCSRAKRNISCSICYSSPMPTVISVISMIPCSSATLVAVEMTPSAKAHSCISGYFLLDTLCVFCLVMVAGGERFFLDFTLTETPRLINLSWIRHTLNVIIFSHIIGTLYVCIIISPHFVSHLLITPND